MSQAESHSNRWLSWGALTVVCATWMLLWTGAGTRTFAQVFAARESTVAQVEPDNAASPDDGSIRKSPTVSASSTLDDLEPRPRGIIDALKQQIRHSPVINEADEGGSLLRSLDEAATLFDDAKRRNREALRRLNRQPLLAGRRAAGNLVMVVCDRLDPQRLSDPRQLEEMPNLSQVAERGRIHPLAYTGSADQDTALWSLLHGRNTGRLPAGEARTTTVRPAEILPELLWQAGYESAFIGGWSLQSQPLDAGFTHWCGFAGTDAPELRFPQRLMLNRAAMAVSANRDGERAVGLWQLLEVEVARWLSAQSKSDHPFFLVVRLPDLEASDAEGRISPEILQAWDQFLGSLTTTLSQQGLQDRTSLVVTALTPEQTSPSGLTERDLRIPLLLAGRGAARTNVSITQPAAHWDLYPTCLDLAGVTRRPVELDGVSLFAKSRQSAAPEPAVLYWRSPANGNDQAVRKGNWKGVYFAKARQLRLYDLASDPSERKNVAGEHPEIARELLFGPPQAVESTLQHAAQPPE